MTACANWCVRSRRGCRGVGLDSVWRAVGVRTAAGSPTVLAWYSYEDVFAVHMCMCSGVMYLAAVVELCRVPVSLSSTVVLCVVDMAAWRFTIVLLLSVTCGKGTAVTTTVVMCCSGVW